MGSAVKSVFGGTDDSAQKAQEDANYRSQKFIEEQSKQAREDAMALFPAAEKNLLAGTQAALDVYGQVLPQQMQAINSGSTAAMDALLGLSKGESSYVPDMSFAQQIAPSLRAPEDRFGTASGIEGSPLNQSDLPSYLAGLQTNKDVLQAASRGDIPGLTGGQEGWLGAFLADPKNAKFLPMDTLLSQPDQLRQQVVGVEGGLSPANEQKFAALLDTIQRPAATAASRFLGGY